MQRNRSVTLSPAAGAANNVAQSQKPAGGGAQALTLNGAAVSGGVATFDVARRVAVASSADDSGRTFTIVGTDRYGRALSEALTGPNATSLDSTRDFKTVTSVTVDGNTAGNVTVGTSGKVSSGWFPTDRYRAINLGVAVRQSGVANWTIEHAMQDPFTPGVGVLPDSGVPTVALTAYPHATLASKSANADGSYTTPITAVRLTLNSFTAGASVTADFAPGAMEGS